MTLFLLLGKNSKNTSPEWNEIIGSVKKYIFTKFITSAATGINNRNYLLVFGN